MQTSEDTTLEAYEAFLRDKIRLAPSWFQFHAGSIKGYCVANNDAVLEAKVSIPRWFD